MMVRGATEKDLELLFEEGWVHFCGSILPPRHGICLFSTLLEFKYFHPDTDENKKIILMTMAWEEILFLMVSIPEEYVTHAEVIAKLSGLSIKHKIPIKISIDNIIIIGNMSIATIKKIQKIQTKETIPYIESFPHMSSRIYSLEYVKEHKAMGSNYDKMDLFKKEEQICNQITNGESVDITKIKSLFQK